MTRHVVGFLGRCTSGYLIGYGVDFALKHISGVSHDMRSAFKVSKPVWAVTLTVLSPCIPEWLRNEKSNTGSKVCRRQVCMSPVHREVPKTNGHSVNLPPSITPKWQPSPRLGRPLSLRAHGTQRYSCIPYIFCVSDRKFFFSSCCLLNYLLL